MPCPACPRNIHPHCPSLHQLLTSSVADILTALIPASTPAEHTPDAKPGDHSTAIWGATQDPLATIPPPQVFGGRRDGGLLAWLLDWASTSLPPACVDGGGVHEQGLSLTWPDHCPTN